MIGFLAKNNNAAKWQKVSELALGMEIAVPRGKVFSNYFEEGASLDCPNDGVLVEGEGDVMWDEIVSIEKVGEERVYDIEVEGTHNFVAGALMGETAFAGIYAHNTYINGGNLGVGTSTPYANLSVAGQAVGSTVAAIDAVSGQTAPILDVKLASTTKFIIDSAGNVGIGTTTPNSLLSVYKAGSTAANSPQILIQASSTVSGLGNFLNNWSIGADSADGGKFKISSSTVIGTSDRLVIDGNGNVGIATSSPGNKLSVVGSGFFDGGTVTASSFVATSSLKLTSTAVSSLLSTDSSGNVIGTSTPTFGHFNATSTSATSTIAGGLAIEGSGLVYDFSSNNVGIGTAAPTGLLDVNGKLTVSATGFSTTTLSGLNISGSATSTSNVGFNITTGCYAVNGTCVGGGSGSGTVNSGVFGQLAFYGANGTTLSGTSTITIATTTNSGRVGIATSTNLNATLTLQGASGLDILRVATSTSGDDIITISRWGGFVQKVASSTAFSVQMASGTPVFEVDTTSNTNAGIDITAGTGQTSNLLNFYSSSNSFLSGFTTAGGLFMNISSTTAINLYDGSGNAAFVVSSAGKSIGVGTSTLTYNFTVQGSQSTSYIARIDNAATDNTADGLLITLGVANASRGTGNYFVGFADGGETVAGKIQGGASAVAYTTTAADFAEYFRVSDLNDMPEAGEIVVLDKTKEKTVKRANPLEGTEEEVFGIVSTNPGFIGNGPICLVGDADCDENYAKYNVLVAVSGQVPLKVSLENGPIKVGDYLTLSSTTPGTAVKLVESGYIVGVAVSEATTADQTISAFIKSGWREVGGSFAEENGVQIPSKWASLFSFLKKVGFEIGQNFIKIANLVTDVLIAEKVETKQLCIDGICIDKDQLKALLVSSGISTSQNSGSTTPSTFTSESITSTSTLPAATSTESVASSPTMETETDTSSAPQEITEEAVTEEPSTESTASEPAASLESTAVSEPAAAVEPAPES